MVLGSFDMFNFYILKGISLIGIGDFFQYGVNELNELLMVGIGLYDLFGDELVFSYGLIVKSVEYVENCSWVVFNLWLEVCFYDGRLIIVSDVVFFYCILVKQGYLMYCIYLQEVKWVDIFIFYWVCFVLWCFGNLLLILCLGEFLVLLQYYWKDCDFCVIIFIVLLGSGFYCIVEVDFGCCLVFECVKGWWGEKLLVNCGKYNFDWVVVDFYWDNGVVFEVFKVGEFDFYIEYQVKNWLNNYCFFVVLCGDVICMEILYQIFSQIQVLFMNICCVVFKECVLCQVLGEMFDFEWINCVFFSNFYLCLCSYYLNSEFVVSGVLEGQEWLYLLLYCK